MFASGENAKQDRIERGVAELAEMPCRADGWRAELLRADVELPHGRLQRAVFRFHREEHDIYRNFPAIFAASSHGDAVERVQHRPAKFIRRGSDSRHPTVRRRRLRCERTNPRKNPFRTAGVNSGHCSNAVKICIRYGVTCHTSESIAVGRRRRSAARKTKSKRSADASNRCNRAIGSELAPRLPRSACAYRQRLRNAPSRIVISSLKPKAITRHPGS